MKRHLIDTEPVAKRPFREPAKEDEDSMTRESMDNNWETPFEGEEWSLLASLVNQLHLTPLHEVAAQLLTQLRRVEGCATCDERSPQNLHCRTICSLFLSSHITGVRLEPVLLSRLLQSSDIRLSQLCTHLRHFSSHLSPRQLPFEIATRLVTFQSTSLQLIVIFRKYEKLFDACVRPRVNDELVGTVFAAGWLLFLCVKAELRETNLHSMFDLVSCSLQVLLTSQVGMTCAAALSCLRTSDPALDALLANKMSVQQENVNRIVRHFKVLNVLIFEHPQAEDVFSSLRLASNLSNLHIYYESQLAHQAMQLDERILLRSFSGLNPEEPPSQQDVKATLFEQECRHSSPITQFMETSTWLSNTLGPRAPTMSEKLTQLLGTDLAAAIQANVLKQQQLLTPSPPELPHVNQTRREIAVKLYHYLLEHILLDELQRTQNKRPWVKSACFHNCLLACAFEVTLFASKVPNLGFPAVLRIFGVTAWAFFKVIETAVRQGGFPPSIKAHLRDVEAMILERLAWVGTGELPALILSPEAKEILKQQHALHTPPLPGPPLEPFALPRAALEVPVLTAGDRFSLSLFFRKLMAIARERLEMVCSDSLLEIPREYICLIWALIVHLLTERTDLLVNRHLDTFILCSIYVICSKIAKMDIKFRRVIAVYLSCWDHNSQQVTRSIYAKANEPTLNIIEFYNIVFIRVTKSFVLREIKPAFLHMEKASNPLSSPNATPLTPPGHRGANSTNFHWSSMPPLRNRLGQQSEALLTPKSRTLYAFNETPEKPPRVNQTVRRSMFPEDSDATESDSSEAESSSFPKPA